MYACEEENEKNNFFFGKKVSKKPFGQNYKPINFVATVSLRYFVSKKIFRK